MNEPMIQNPHLEGDAFVWPGGPVGVLMIHGYTATTAEVRPLGKLLHERGYTVAGPLLPGHGTTPQDLNRQRWTDWTATVEQAYRELAARCERVFIAGESMGAVLALYLASEHPELEGLMLYAPALQVPRDRVILGRLLQHITPIRPKPAKGKPTVADTRWKGYTVNGVRAAVQLFDLQQETLRRLERVHQPLLILQGRLDVTIDPRSGETILRQVRSTEKDLYWLEDSTHCVILDCELDRAATLTLDFMARALQRASDRNAVTRSR